MPGKIELDSTCHWHPTGFTIQLEAESDMAFVLPKWVMTSWKQKYPPILVAAVAFSFGHFYFDKPFDLEHSKYKGKSALYKSRKIPDGQDPWEY